MKLPIYCISDNHFSIIESEYETIRRNKLFSLFKKIKKTGGTLIIGGDFFDFWFDYKNHHPNYNTLFLHLSELDKEGRVITLEFDKYFLIHVYTPNSGQALQRLEYRVKKWDIHFRKYLKNLQKSKKIIVCGDLNVANEDIDIHSPKTNLRSSGFTIEERNSFSYISMFHYSSGGFFNFNCTDYGQEMLDQHGWEDVFKVSIGSEKILNYLQSDDSF